MSRTDETNEAQVLRHEGAQVAQASGLPALYGHCVAVYKAMDARATFRKADGSEQEMLIYEGRLTRLVTGNVNLSVPYYTKCRKALLYMKCIRQLKRGGGMGGKSQWELLRPPTEELFREYLDAEAETPRDNPTDQRIRDLTRRVANLEDLVEFLLNENDESTEGEN